MAKATIAAKVSLGAILMQTSQGKEDGMKICCAVGFQFGFKIKKRMNELKALQVVKQDFKKQKQSWKRNIK